MPQKPETEPDDTTHMTEEDFLKLYNRLNNIPQPPHQQTTNNKPTPSPQPVQSKKQNKLKVPREKPAADPDEIGAAEYRVGGKKLLGMLAASVVVGLVIGLLLLALR